MAKCPRDVDDHLVIGFKCDGLECPYPLEKDDCWCYEENKSKNDKLKAFHKLTASKKNRKSTIPGKCKYSAFRVSVDWLDKIDELIKRGITPSRSAFIRKVLKNGLEIYFGELE